jgi:signal transduction histidine kinase
LLSSSITEELDLEISVSDTGVGIDEEHIKTLFSNFKKIKENRELNR